MRPVVEQPIFDSRSASPTLLRRLFDVFREYGYRINRVLPRDGTEALEGPLTLMTYTVATEPAAADYPGAIIYVSDGAAGQKFRGSDGAAWVNLG